MLYKRRTIQYHTIANLPLYSIREHVRGQGLLVTWPREGRCCPVQGYCTRPVYGVNYVLYKSLYRLVLYCSIVCCYCSNTD